MNFNKIIILIIISSLTFNTQAQDLIKYTRAGIKPSEVPSNNITPNLVNINTLEVWDEKKAIQAKVLEVSSKNDALLSTYKAYFDDAVFYDIKKQELQYLFELKPKDLLFLMPVEGENNIILQLTRVNLTSKDIVNPTCIHYKGFIKGSPGSHASVSLTNTSVSGLIADPGGNYNLSKTTEYDNSCVLYNDKELKIKRDFSCGTSDDDFGFAGKRADLNYDNSAEKSAEVAPCISVYIDCGYSLFEEFNTVSNVTDYIMGIFNNVKTIYETAGIDLKISNINVRQFPDNLYSIGNQNILLDAFAEDIKDNFDGNIAHLVTFRGRTDSINGIANLNVIHKNYYTYYQDWDKDGIEEIHHGGPYALSNLGIDEYSPFEHYSRDVFVMTHEIGHNLGSPHTHACKWGPNKDMALDGCEVPEPIEILPNGDTLRCARPNLPIVGTIMSYCTLWANIGVDFYIGFHQEVRALIYNNVVNINCKKRGCMDNNACNFVPSAEEDDGSCSYLQTTCTDFYACNYDPNPLCSDNSKCEYEYDNSIFNNYTWIRTKLNEQTCRQAGVKVYDKDSQKFVFIQKKEGSTLYYLGSTSNTPVWDCVDGVDTDCREHYQLSNSNQIARSCGCVPCTTQTCNTNPCLEGGVQQWNSSSCSCDIIEVTKEGCDDPSACNYDPSVNCEDNSQCTYYPTCNNNCNDLSIYNSYSWLSTIADNEVCNFDKITVISDGYYSYIYVASSNKGILYSADGSFWAADSGDYYYVNWYIENAGFYEIACLICNPLPLPACNYTGTFFFDDCGGTNYYFIRLEDGRIFDPYLTDEDLNRLFENGIVQEVQVNFGYKINNTINTPCDVSEQAINITCIELVEPACNDGIQNGNEEGIDCGGSNCNPCNLPQELPQIFVNYPELLDLVDPFNCNGETVMVYDYGTYVYIYVTINEVGTLYYLGSAFCFDEPSVSCMSPNPTDTWSCGANMNHLNKSDEKMYKKTPININQKIDNPSSFIIFPNPSTGKVLVELKEFNTQNTLINIYEVSGRKAHTTKIGDTVNESNIELNLSHLEKGVYIVELKNETSTQTKKLLIN